MILGVDPGLANVGWGVVKGETELVGYGQIKTKEGLDLGLRLVMIYDKLADLIDKYKVEAMAIEGLYFAKNVKSAMKVAKAMGVISLVGLKKGIKVVEYTPLQIKVALTGYGRADKDQIKYMVQKLTGVEELKESDHAVDAVAVALTHLMTKKLG